MDRIKVYQVDLCMSSMLNLIMTLEELREAYRTASDEDKVKIAEVGKAVKENPKYGSVEVGGNGFCSECFLEPARPAHYNCEKCAEIKVYSKNRYSIEHMMERTKKMTGYMVDRMKTKPWQNMAEDVFA